MPSISLSRILNRTAPKKNQKKTSAHAAHFSTIKIDEEGNVVPGITKENKHGNKEASVLEVGFTAVANIFTLPKHIFKMDLVTDHNGEVFGVFSDHAANALLRMRKEDPNTVFLKVPSFEGDPVPEITNDKAFVKTLKASEPIPHATTVMNKVYGKPDMAWVDNLTKKYTKKGMSKKEIANLRNDIIEKLASFQKVPPARVHNLLLNASYNASSQQVSIYKEIASRVLLIGQPEPVTFAFDKIDMAWVSDLSNLYGLSEETIIETYETIRSFENLPNKKDASLGMRMLFANITPKEKACFEEITARVQLIKQCKQNQDNIVTQQQVAAHGAGKGFNFLHMMPPNFFAKLMQARKLGDIYIDMESLVDVLATAHGLEEDDLHKGNIGFYVTLKEGKPCYHFFKIDHDLMFNAKIMATRDQRAANWAYDVDIFKIDAASLKNFPDITGPHYWPTNNPKIVTGTKTYKNKEDRNAFKSLKNDTDFIEYKWKRCLKQAVIPESLLSKSLDVAYANHSGGGKVRVDIERNTIEKMSERKIALLANYEFRKIFMEDPDSIMDYVLKEIETEAKLLGYKELTPDEKKLASQQKNDISICMAEAKEMLEAMRQACHLYKGRFTDLHAAIMTRSYRPPQSAIDFKDQLNLKDNLGKTALDYAVIQYEALRGEQKFKELYYYEEVIRDLHTHGAVSVLCTPKFLASTEKVTGFEAFQIKMMQLALSSKSISQVKGTAIDILKNSELSKNELLEVKKLLITEAKEPLNFMKKLESKSYLMKKIRGEFGNTSASKAMLQLIDEKIKNSAQKEERIKNPFSRLFRLPKSKVTAEPETVKPERHVAPAFVPLPTIQEDIEPDEEDKPSTFNNP